jgi:hypothetical protein
MASSVREFIPATIFFRDTQVRFLDAESWQDEDGSYFFRSTEFPFLITSAETEQDAVNKLVADAESFFFEVDGLADADEATKPELMAAAELGRRLVEGYSELERRQRKAARAKLIGRARKQMRGNFIRSPETPDRSPQASRA